VSVSEQSLQDKIKPGQPRESVQVRFHDGRIYEGPVGTPLVAFMDVAPADDRGNVTAALVDGQFRELGFQVMRDCDVRPVDTYSSDGLRIYQRAMTFVMIVAARELFPEARLLIDHSVTLGAFFCQVVGRPDFTEIEMAALSERMHEIIAANEPIHKERLPLQAAIELFTSQGYDDKVRLFAGREDAEVTVYTLRGVRDYFYGHMLPSTGRLNKFTLEHYLPGFILRSHVPRHAYPLESHGHYPKLMEVFREYGRWLRILGIEDVGSMNAAIEKGEAQSAVLVSEALHEKRISEIAGAILARDDVRLVLVAGPSSSGKTTFARRLGIQLMASEHRPLALGLDDYFIDRDLTPVDERGEKDYESLRAVNVELFNEQLAALMAGERVQIPHYDFVQGKSVPGPELALAEDSVLIVEGIHGLNPELVYQIPEDMIFRVYVSAVTQLNLDHHNRIPTTDNRLLRRMVRDHRYRGIRVAETIRRWPDVRLGEERNIFPYQENADVLFNSALVYELSVLKPLVEPLLLQVPSDTPEAVEVRRLLSFLRWLKPCESNLVPGNSLLREFIGGSVLRGFML
jgi:uridine kinase